MNQAIHQHAPPDATSEWLTSESVAIVIHGQAWKLAPEYEVPERT